MVQVSKNVFGSYIRWQIVSLGPSAHGNSALPGNQPFSKPTQLNMSIQSLEHPRGCTEALKETC